MAFGEFVKKNLGPSLIGGGGALIGVWGFLGDARDMWTAGIEPAYLQLSGFLLFVLATISVLYRQHEMIELRLAAQSPPPLPQEVFTLVEKPESKPAPKPLPVDTPAVSDPEPPVEEIRQYAPASFVKDLAAFLETMHTSLQRDAFLEPHLGQWIRARAYLPTTSDHGDTITAHVSFGSLTNTIYVVFPATWRSQLARLVPGQFFDFEAQIIKNHVGRPHLANGAML